MSGLRKRTDLTVSRDDRFEGSLILSFDGMVSMRFDFPSTR